MIWILTAYLILSAAGTVVAAHALHVWGWGDATFGDRRNHLGIPDDAWHKRRRKAGYAVLVFAAGLNPIFVAFLAWKGRALFRGGVWEASPETYRAWFLKDEPRA